MFVTCSLLCGSPMSDHFPTFRRAQQVSANLARRLRRPSFWRSLRTERGLLRAALYLLLFCSLVALVAGRLTWPAMGPAFYRGGYPPPEWSYTPGGWIVYPIIAFISRLVPPPMEILVAAVCLAGLAASCERPRDSGEKPRQADGRDSPA
jgi:hypothetical protein